MPDPLPATLAGIVGDGHVLVDPDLTQPYERDWTGRFGGRARCVVRPADTGEVAATVSACAAAGAAIVAQGGNTGLVGGSVPRGGEVVLSLSRLQRLGSVDPETAQVTAGAGVPIAALHTAADAAGLAYGVDLASRDSATVGGTIATNAGGIRVIRHGPTRSQVLGIEAVLADGRVLRRMQALPKDATGYDLPALLTGSEGTLAVLTAARLRLVARDACRVAALLALPSTGAAIAVLATVRRRIPDLAAAEWFHARGLRLVCESSGATEPFARTHPTYLLLEAAGAEDPTGALAAAVEAAPDVIDVAVGSDRSSREALWAYRERHSEALQRAGAVEKFDVGIPLRNLERFEREAGRLCDRAGVELITYGHLAEGNVHVNVRLPLPGNGADAGTDLDEPLLRLVAGLGGSISAEHGVGVVKTRWLSLTRDATDRAAMAAVKRALDPQGILNRGVLFA